MRPNAKDHTSNPDYLRHLVETSGLSIGRCAKQIGVSRRTLSYWLSGEVEIPYTAIFALESLACDPLLDWLKRAKPYLEENRQIPDRLYWELEPLIDR